MSQISATGVSTFLEKRPKKTRIRILDARGKAYTTRRGAEQLVERGRARWENDLTIRIIEDDGKQPAAGPVRKLKHARHRPRFQFAPYVPPPAYERPCIAVTPEWLLSVGYQLKFGMGEKK